MNPYEKCAVVETESFTIRLIEEGDAKDLFRCYHDKDAVAFMNDDNCDFGFYSESEERMAETIGYWIDFYKKGYFIRFSIVDRKSGAIIGTIEGFSGEIGVLRIDILSTYETASSILQILEFASKNFNAYFGNDTLVTKAIPSAIERRKVLEESGWKFIDKFRDYSDYYQIKLVEHINVQR